MLYVFLFIKIVARAKVHWATSLCHSLVPHNYGDPFPQYIYVLIGFRFHKKSLQIFERLIDLSKTILLIIWGR